MATKIISDAQIEKLRAEHMPATTANRESVVDMCTTVLINPRGSLAHDLRHRLSVLWHDLRRADRESAEHASIRGAEEIS